MAQEISIHRSLKHEHVVGFHSFFEDNNFVYIVLELCKRRVSLCYQTDYLLIYLTVLLLCVESDGIAQEKKSCH
jgi:serine/threonine protein kinase